MKQETEDSGDSLYCDICLIVVVWTEAEGSLGPACGAYPAGLNEVLNTGHGAC